MKKLLLIVLSILTCFCMAIGLTACGKDGQSNTPTIEIGSDGYWYINGTKTDYKASGEKGEQGEKGDKGDKGDSGEQGEKGEKGDKGDAGEKGSDGINGSNGVDGKDGINGSDGKDGKDGKDGRDGVDGKTPEIKIGENGNWFIDGVDTNVKAQGEKGDKGDAGENGSDGKDGVNGSDGKDGVNGSDGKDGVNGSDGKDGNGVKTIVINDKGELIITLDDGTVINAGQVVAPEKHIDENNQIICKTFKKTDKTIYGKVANDTDTFYFTDEIELKGGASYSVYKDFDCSDEIISKAVKLNVGNNTFYILEKCGNDSKFYTVTVRRREIYTVTFAISDGTAIENSTFEIEEDDIIPKERISALSRNGYDIEWDYDFTMPITQNTNIAVTLKAIYTISGNEITGLTDYGKTLSALNIPNKIDGNEITGIGNRAFCDNKSLTSVTIPDSVTSIGEQAFSSSNINSIIIGNSVTSIGEAAFKWCFHLTTVIVGSGVEFMGDGVFFDCDNLESVVILEGLKIISRYMVANCDKLTSVIIPDSVTSISDFAFKDCNELKTILYKGTVEHRRNISIGALNNYCLDKATWYYYSETEPALNAEGTAYDGNYWRYDADGKMPLIWKKEN